MRIIKIFGLISFFLIVAAGAAFFWREQIMMSILTRSVPAVRSIATSTPSSDFVSDFIGMKSTRSYLLLFLNNTEMRPGGGFIGSYAVINLKGGRPEIAKVEGTEILDLSRSDFDLPTPPDPIAKYLKVDKWYFRDSNWSPDFASSSEQSLSLYKKENGLNADDIYGVIGVTPTVIAELLRISGPIKIGDLEFTADNLVEKLEYQVEYGYKDQDIKMSDRKNIMGDLARTLLDRLKFDLVLNWKKYLDLANRLISEKQIMVYSPVASAQSVLRNMGWTGEMPRDEGDYLLWVDANLGALKTDLAVEKTLGYELIARSGSATATAMMTYRHSGKFDWRTSRYRDYARVFVPSGSTAIECVRLDGEGRVVERIKCDTGRENGRDWLGAYIVVSPGETQRLAFRYTVSSAVVRMIDSGRYDLSVQKQLGATGYRLTLNLDFGKTLTTGHPTESPSDFGDAIYRQNLDLLTDQTFSVTFQP